MKNPRLAMNRRMELKILHGPYAGRYPTRIVSFDNDALTLIHPIVDQVPIPLAVGDVVQIENCLSGVARCVFVTDLLRFHACGAPAIAVALPDRKRSTRLERRNFIRLKTSLKLTCSPGDSPAEGEAAEPVPGRTRVISGNGAEILCCEEYPPGKNLWITLELPDSTIRTAAEVIRGIEPAKPSGYWCGVCFTGIPDRQRDRIVRHIFREQLKQRRKGLR